MDFGGITPTRKKKSSLENLQSNFSLRGPNKRKVLANLREFETIFPSNPGLCQKFSTAFELLHKVMCFIDCSKNNHSECSHLVKTLKSLEETIQEMKTVWVSLVGHNAVTPYFHCLEYHVPQMIERSKFGSISHFSLIGQEAKHKIQTAIQFRATNNRDTSVKVLLHELSLAYLQKDETIFQLPYIEKIQHTHKYSLEFE